MVLRLLGDPWTAHSAGDAVPGAVGTAQRERALAALTQGVDSLHPPAASLPILQCMRQCLFTGPGRWRQERASLRVGAPAGWGGERKRGGVKSGGKGVRAENTMGGYRVRAAAADSVPPAIRGVGPRPLPSTRPAAAAAALRSAGRGWWGVGGGRRGPAWGGAAPCSLPPSRHDEGGLADHGVNQAVLDLRFGGWVASGAGQVWERCMRCGGTRQALRPLSSLPTKHKHTAGAG